MSRFTPWLALLLTAQPLVSLAEVQEEFHHTYPLTKDGRFEFNGINGKVHITGWDRPEVQVDAIKRGETQRHIDNAKIIVQAKADRISIRTKYGKEELEPELWRHAPRVDYEIKVPSGVSLRDVENVNGTVDLEGVTSQVRVSCRNGRLFAKGLMGETYLDCVNGAVLAEFKALNKAVTIKSVNGAVDLKLPQGANADVNAKTVNGSLRTNIKSLNKSKGIASSELNGKIGGGGTPVRVKAVNGSVNVTVAE